MPTHDAAHIPSLRNRTLWVLLSLAALATFAAVRRHSAPPLNAGTPATASTSEQAPISSPAEALEQFQIDPRFRLELVAAEPMVEAPVAMSFDEDGRAWVVEMRAFMRDTEGTKELEPSGRIVVLEDTDHDGRMDRRRVFLDGLVLPRAVAPCHGGALVIAPPDLIFARDTDGDGKADERRVLMTGLGGIESPEHAANGLLYGLDNWWHLSQHGQELRFDGSKAEVRATPTVGQWGLTQDEQGRLYYTPNSEALRVDLFPKHYAARNPDARDLAGINRLASPDQTVWPLKPTPGVNRAYMDHVLRPDGTLASHTAACGPTLYFADLFPNECRGNAFVCEPAANLVRRLTVQEGRDGPIARNAYERAEFLTSPDERFRPVNTCVGPDGALYIVDMHRGIIQHKLFLTPHLREHIKARQLEMPVHFGRIYRIVPTGAATRSQRSLSKASDAELVGVLDHANSWQASNAQRLLVERQATGAEAQLRETATRAARWPTRLRALWTLQGLGVLTEVDTAQARADADARVRTAGVRLAEGFLASTSERTLALFARDADVSVRRQVALSLGQIAGEQVVRALAECVAADPTDEVLHACVLSGVRGRQREMLDEVVRRGLEKPGWKALGERLIAAIVSSDDAREREWIVGRLARMTTDDSAQARLLLGAIERRIQPKSRSPYIVRLPNEPTGWAELLARRDDLGTHATAISECMEWPGKPSPVAARQPRSLSPRERALFERGERVYSLCFSCHGPDGRGTPGQAPSLAGSALAQGPRGVPIRIVLHGLDASTVGSDAYPVMPPVPLNDESAAAVLTYIRRAWSNVAEPILPEHVREVREQAKARNAPWRRAELEAIQ